jgi:hypothetical protein
VPEILELPHLVEQHGVAEVEVGRGRVEARLHAERPAELEPGQELVALDDLVGAAADQIERVLQFGPGNSCWDETARPGVSDSRLEGPPDRHFGRRKRALQLIIG